MIQSIVSATKTVSFDLTYFHSVEEPSGRTADTQETIERNEKPKFVQGIDNPYTFDLADFSELSTVDLGTIADPEEDPFLVQSVKPL